MWRAALIAVGLVLAPAASGCGDFGSWPRSFEQGVTGQCLRDAAAPRGSHVCSTDAMCPCGEFCDAIDHVCRATCAAPPSSEGGLCTGGAQCNLSGRCVSPAIAHRAAL